MGLQEYAKKRDYKKSAEPRAGKSKNKENLLNNAGMQVPQIVSTFDREKIKKFGSEIAMKRAGRPSELALAYDFLASDDASFITCQLIHVIGGEIVNG